MTPKMKKLADAVREALGANCLELRFERDEVDILVVRNRLPDVMEKLHKDEAIEMNQLMDIAGVDWPERSERFEVVYQLLSLKHNWRLRVRARTDEASPVPSVSSVYSSAGWYEREVFDMFGIVFQGHPDLRRILTDYDFAGYPLRRDFPLVGFTQVRYDDAQRRVVQEPVRLEQVYRAFDALSPWQGLTDIQRRGEGKV